MTTFTHDGATAQIFIAAGYSHMSVYTGIPDISDETRMLAAEFIAYHSLKGVSCRIEFKGLRSMEYYAGVEHEIRQKAAVLVRKHMDELEKPEGGSNG